MQTEEEWLECRKTVVTATEASILLGQNKYLSPNKMLSEKFKSTFKGNAFTRVGHLLEPVVIEVVNQELNMNFKQLETEGKRVFYLHPTEKLGCTPDAQDREVFLECKTTKPFNFLRYKYCPPHNYLMQLQTQLICAMFDYGYLAIMSTDLSPESENSDIPIVLFKVEKSDLVEKLLLKEVKRFWMCYNENKMFRVNSKVKKQVKLALDLCFRRI